MRSYHSEEDDLGGSTDSGPENGSALKERRRLWRLRHPNTYALEWLADLNTGEVLASMPRALYVGCGTTRNALYQSEGILRSEEDHCVFQYTLEGEGMFRYTAREYRIPAGRGFLCRLNDPQVSYGFPEHTLSSWRWVWVVIAGGAAKTIVAELFAAFGPVYALPADGPVIRKLMSFERHPYLGGSDSLCTASILAIEVLSALAAAATAGRAGLGSGDLVTRVKDLIVRHHTRPDLTASAIARRLNVSREHVSRMFSQTTHRGIAEAIEKTRIDHASDLLFETDLSVKQIAARSGYAGYDSFERAFKRVTGSSPRRFRTHGAQRGPSFRVGGEKGVPDSVVPQDYAVPVVGGSDRGKRPVKRHALEPPRWSPGPQSCPRFPQPSGGD